MALFTSVLVFNDFDMISGGCIAFFDDDNELEGPHTSVLNEASQHNKTQKLKK